MSPPRNPAAENLYEALQECKAERDEARIQREEYGRENERLRDALAELVESPFLSESGRAHAKGIAERNNP